MNTFFANIMYRLLVLLISISTAFGTAALPATDDAIKSLDSENVKMTAVLWGDSQISDYLISREKSFKNACIDVSGAAENIDALLIAGDVTENGKVAEYRVILDDLSLIDTVDNYIIATGNHDVRLRLHSQAVKTFYEFLGELNSNIEPSDEFYYSYDVNGYTFIVLGTTKSTFEEAHISDEELSWLDSELSAATANGKPAFVVVHQPLAYSHNLPAAWGSPIESAGSIGAQSDEVRAIMDKHSNVFLISGHLHSGFSEYSFEDIGNIHSVNLPSVSVENSGGYEESGIGFMLEVYEDSVVFRARDFAKGKYLPEFDHTYMLSE